MFAKRFFEYTEQYGYIHFLHEITDVSYETKVAYLIFIC